jgi:hypothetical protein
MNKYGIDRPTPAPGTTWGDIIETIIDAYLAKQDPYFELKKAAGDPTKQIRYKDTAWRDAGYPWEWLQDARFYEIRDKPKSTKKVKMLAWLTPTGQLMWCEEMDTGIHDWLIRVPSEDKEIEVEDD